MSRLSIIRGDDSTFDVAVSDSDSGDPVDVTEAESVTFTAKRAYRDADDDALIRKDLADGITVDEDGIHVAIAAADTVDLAAPIVLVWDVEVIDADSLTHTVANGTIRIEPDVTRAAAGS